MTLADDDRSGGTRESATPELEATTSLLLEAAGSLASGLSLDEVLDRLCAIVLRALPHKRVTVYLWSEADSHLEIAASRGQSAVPLGTATRIEDLSEPARTGIGERGPVLIDFDALPPDAIGIARRMPAHLALDVPLFYGEGFVGLLAIDDGEDRCEFTEREIEIATGIASQAAVAIANARLYEAERAARRQADQDLATTKSLLEAARTISTTIELDEALSQLAGVALKLTGLSRAFVNLIDTGRRVLTPMIATGGLAAPGGSPIAFDRLSKTSLDAIMGKKTVVLDYELPDTPEYDREIARANDSRILLFVPLVVGNDVVGHITLDEPGERHEFSERDIELVEGIASQGAVVVRNAQLYGAERDIADRLQEALLALPASVPGVDFAHAYHSATETARVGGDFYDVFELSHDHVGVVIGDMAGKGLDAAVLTSLVKNTIRAHAYEMGKTPAQILELTNRIVYKATSTEAFVTVFFAMLDCRDGRLVYASAGHTTIAVLREDGTIARLRPTGPMLGAFQDVGFDQAEARLDFDEMLFLYTDGLTEARRNGELYGEERLFEFLASAPRSPSEVLSEAIREAVSFSRNDLRDDLAILVLRRDEQGDETPHQGKLGL